jgi:hypothetical protein
MFYTLAVQKTDLSPEIEQNYKKISSILSVQEDDMIYVKHHQNFYDQSLSHFIIIESKTNTNDGKSQLRIRRIYPLINPSIK